MRCECGVWGTHSTIYKTRRAALRNAEREAAVDNGAVFAARVITVRDGYQVQTAYLIGMCDACYRPRVAVTR